MRRANARGFTLIELMITVAILGVIAAVAITAYSKNIKRARRTEIVGDVAKISILQETAFRVRGHYVSTTGTTYNGFPGFYPSAAAFAGAGQRKASVFWDIQDPGYHLDGTADGPHFRGGGGEHGFDALDFMPDGGNSRCSYASHSGMGLVTDPVTNSLIQEMPNGAYLGVMFVDDDRFKLRPWFINMAACDLDDDGKYWFFFNTSYNSRVSDELHLPGANIHRGAY